MELYDLTTELLEIEDLLNSEEEIPKENLIELQEIIKKNLENEATNIAYYIKNKELLIEARKAEEKRLKKSRQKMEQRLEKFKEYVTSNLIQLGEKKIETSIGNISIRKSSSVVVNIDPAELQDEYKKTKFVVEADKRAIKEAINSGKKVEGAEIVDNFKLSIK